MLFSIFFVGRDVERDGREKGRDLWSEGKIGGGGWGKGLRIYLWKFFGVLG